MQYLLPDKTYKALKWTGLIALPAIATFVGSVGTAAGWGQTGLCVTVVTALGTLIGTLCGVSQVTAKEAGPDAD